MEQVPLRYTGMLYGIGQGCPKRVFTTRLGLMLGFVQTSYIT